MADRFLGEYKGMGGLIEREDDPFDAAMQRYMMRLKARDKENERKAMEQSRLEENLQATSGVENQPPPEPQVEPQQPGYGEEYLGTTEEGAPAIMEAPGKPYVQRLAEGLGLDKIIRSVTEKLATTEEQRKQRMEQDLTGTYARDEYGSPEEFLGLGLATNKEPGYFARSWINSVAFGMPEAMVRGSTGGKYGFIGTPETPGEKAAAGVGSLLGFIVSPAQITGKALGKVYARLPFLMTAEGAPALGRILKSMVTEGVSLGAASSLHDMGKALESRNFDAFTDALVDSFKGGAYTGAVFGGLKGKWPGAKGTDEASKALRRVDRIKRIAAGLALLEGPTLADKKDIDERVFSIGMDLFFLWNGMGDEFFDYSLKRIEDKVEKGTPPGQAINEEKDAFVKGVALGLRDIPDALQGTRAGHRLRSAIEREHKARQLVEKFRAEYEAEEDPDIRAAKKQNLEEVFKQYEDAFEELKNARAKAEEVHPEVYEQLRKDLEAIPEIPPEAFVEGGKEPPPEEIKPEEMVIEGGEGEAVVRPILRATNGKPYSRPENAEKAIWSARKRHPEYADEKWYVVRLKKRHGKGYGLLPESKLKELGYTVMAEEYKAKPVKTIDQLSEESAKRIAEREAARAEEETRALPPGEERKLLKAPKIEEQKKLREPLYGAGKRPELPPGQGFVIREPIEPIEPTGSRGRKTQKREKRYIPAIRKAIISGKSMPFLEGKFGIRHIETRKAKTGNYVFEFYNPESDKYFKVVVPKEEYENAIASAKKAEKVKEKIKKEKAKRKRAEKKKEKAKTKKKEEKKVAEVKVAKKKPQERAVRSTATMARDILSGMAVGEMESKYQVIVDGGSSEHGSNIVSFQFRKAEKPEDKIFVYVDYDKLEPRWKGLVKVGGGVPGGAKPKEETKLTEEKKEEKKPVTKRLTPGQAVVREDNIIEEKRRRKEEVKKKLKESKAKRREGIKEAAGEILPKPGEGEGRRTKLVEEDEVPEKERRENYFLRAKIDEIDDIEELRRITHELRNKVMTDELTGLPNLTAMVHSEEPHKYVAYADIDSLKFVNDNFGKFRGDEYIKLFANALKTAAKQNGTTLYRIHGDEFVITSNDKKKLHATAQSARKILNSINFPLSETDYINKPGFSIGYGESHETADKKMKANKIERTNKGLRAGREEPPVGLGKVSKKELKARKANLINEKLKKKAPTIADQLKKERSTYGEPPNESISDDVIPLRDANIALRSIEHQLRVLYAKRRTTEQQAQIDVYNKEIKKLRKLRWQAAKEQAKILADIDPQDKGLKQEASDLSLGPKRRKALLHAKARNEVDKDVYRRAVDILKEVEESVDESGLPDVPDNLPEGAKEIAFDKKSGTKKPKEKAAKPQSTKEVKPEGKTSPGEKEKETASSEKWSAIDHYLYDTDSVITKHTEKGGYETITFKHEPTGVEYTIKQESGSPFRRKDYYKALNGALRKAGKLEGAAKPYQQMVLDKIKQEYDLTHVKTIEGGKGKAKTYVFEDAVGNTYEVKSPRTLTMAKFEDRLLGTHQGVAEPEKPAKPEKPKPKEGKAEKPKPYRGAKTEKQKEFERLTNSYIVRIERPKSGGRKFVMYNEDHGVYFGVDVGKGKPFPRRSAYKELRAAARRAGYKGEFPSYSELSGKKKTPKAVPAKAEAKQENIEETEKVVEEITKAEDVTDKIPEDLPPGAVAVQFDKKSPLAEIGKQISEKGDKKVVMLTDKEQSHLIDSQWW